MGGKSSPDYSGAAAAQGEANREVVRDQTFANRPDQFTPWGATSWTPYQGTDPSTGEAVTQWSQTQSLTPELQDILNKQIAIQSGRSDVAGALTGRMGAEFTQPMDWRGLNPMGEVPTQQYTIPEEMQRNLDYSDIAGIESGAAYRDRAENAIYEKGANRLGSQFDTRREQMEVKLRNQGLAPGDAAYQSQMQSLSDQENDAYGNLQMDALTAGRAEQDQMFNQASQRRNTYTNERDRAAAFYNQSGQQAYSQAMGANQQNYQQAMAGSQYANQIRQQQITEAMTKRGFSLNEINGLLSGQQVNTPQMPSFQGASAAQAAPIYQSAVDQGNYNAGMSPWNAVLGAAGTLGGAYLGNPSAFGG